MKVTEFLEVKGTMFSVPVFFLFSEKIHATNSQFLIESDWLFKKIKSVCL